MLYWSEQFTGSIPDFDTTWFYPTPFTLPFTSVLLNLCNNHPIATAVFGWCVYVSSGSFQLSLKLLYSDFIQTDQSTHERIEREHKLLSTAPKCFYSSLYCATYFDVTIEFDILYISSQYGEVVGIPGCLMCYWNICLRSSATFNLPLFISFRLIYFFTFTYLLNLITP